MLLFSLADLQFNYLKYFYVMKPRKKLFPSHQSVNPDQSIVNTHPKSKIKIKTYIWYIDILLITFIKKKFKNWIQIDF